MIINELPNHAFAQRDLLAGVEVRLVSTFERERWKHLMISHHYLGFQRAFGEQVFYVATINGEWIGLVGWASAALKLQSRDCWIGWDAIAKKRRLNLIANNMRFLVLPGWQVANLASRILALNLKRLSSDWQAIYGHPILVVETFVDAERFRGSCYRATGFRDIGLTRGFSRSRTS